MPLNEAALISSVVPAASSAASEPSPSVRRTPSGCARVLLNSRLRIPNEPLVSSSVRLTSWSRLAADFPGDPSSGALEVDANGDPVADFDDFANHEPCPALDPEHGTCDLYASRPQTCRVFGPPIATGEGYGICELCFQSANEDEIARAAIRPPAEELSVALDQAAITAGEPAGSTIVAFVLKSGDRS